MKTLIVGRHDQQTEAENARRELPRAGFSGEPQTEDVQACGRNTPKVAAPGA